MQVTMNATEQRGLIARGCNYRVLVTFTSCGVTYPGKNANNLKHTGCEPGSWKQENMKKGGN